VTGQDGSYLAKLLVEKGYEVYGTTRSYDRKALWRLSHLRILSKIETITCDPNDSLRIFNLVSNVKPTEIYNLAAQSSVSLSFAEPGSTLLSNLQSVVNLLESIRTLDPKIRFYQASSSEIFGNAAELPICEETRMNPISPYGSSKAAAHWTTRNYRDAFGIFACSGILFNHESVLRSPQFFVKKVVSNAAAIARGEASKLELGNLSVERDFGFAPEYVRAMWLMLQHDKPDDFVICSGTPISLQAIVDYTLGSFGLPADLVVTKKENYRPNEIDRIYGSNAKAKRDLGWSYETDFFTVLDKIIDYEKCGE